MANESPVSELCYIHGHEPLPEAYFCLCGECGHVYTTAEDLIRAYVDEEPEPKGPVPNAADIAFCPYCMHDF